MSRNRARLHLLLLSAATAVLGQRQFHYNLTWGGGPGGDNSIQKAYVWGAQVVENTQNRSVNFKPFAEIQSPSQPNGNRAAWQDVEWTWRVTTVNFPAVPAQPVADLRRPDPQPLVNPHVTPLSYDFSWPHPDDFDPSDLTDSIMIGPSASRDSGFRVASFCAAALMTKDVAYFPANVSNAFGQDHAGSTDCAPALGSGCVDAIIRAAEQSRQDGGSGCPSADSLMDHPECASTIGYMASNPRSAGIDDFVAPFAWDLVNPNATADRPAGLERPPTAKTVAPPRGPSTAHLTSGERFWGAVSWAENGTNETTHWAMAHTLQILLIDPVLTQSPNASNGTAPAGRNVTLRGRPQLLCTRVNTTELEVGEEGANAGTAAVVGGAQGGGGGEGGSDEDEENAAGGVAVPVIQSVLATCLASVMFLL